LWKDYFTKEHELNVKIIDIDDDGIISLAIPEISL
jgi:predicted RNA-binding protein with RPS1 domain